MLGFLRCLLFDHMPNRRRVKKLPGDKYIGYCQYCNARIRRVKRDQWVRDWGRLFGGSSAAAEAEEEAATAD